MQVSRFHKGTCSIVDTNLVRHEPTEALYFSVEYEIGKNTTAVIVLCVVQSTYGYTITDPESGASVYKLQMVVSSITLHRAVCATQFRKRLHQHVLATMDLIDRRLTLRSFAQQLAEKRTSIPAYTGTVHNPLKK